MVTWMVAMWMAVSPVAIEVSPRFGRAPQTIRIRVQVEPHRDNRVLCVGYVGTRDRESCEGIDGGTARTRWVEFRDLPGGRYTVFAVVSGVNDRRFQVTRPLCVVGGVAEGDVDCGSGGAETGLD